MVMCAPTDKNSHTSALCIVYRKSGSGLAFENLYLRPFCAECSGRRGRCGKILAVHLGLVSLPVALKKHAHPCSQHARVIDRHMCIYVYVYIYIYICILRRSRVSSYSRNA